MPNIIYPGAGKILRAPDIAQKLGVSQKTASGLMKTMPCINLGLGKKRLYLAVAENDFNRWLEDRKTVPAEDAIPAKKKARAAARIQYESETEELIRLGLMTPDGRAARKRA